MKRALCQSGFTLLEMLFVMLVVGLLVGLTAPRFGAGIDRYEIRSQREHIEDQLRQLPRRVRLAARSLELPQQSLLSDLGDGAPVLDLPPGWTIAFSPPLVISRLGACNETKIVLSPPESSGETPPAYKITDLSCEVLPQTP